MVTVASDGAAAWPRVHNSLSVPQYGVPARRMGDAAGFRISMIPPACRAQAPAAQPAKRPELIGGSPSRPLRGADRIEQAHLVST